jgi:hypothetical protein
MLGSNGHKGSTSTTTFGELVAAVFEQAMAATSDPREAARLASVVIERLLRLSGRGSLVLQLTS